MKKLLQINTVVNCGSTGKIVEAIGQIVIQNGWSSYIAFGRDEKPSKSKLIKIGKNIDIKFHGLQTRLFDRHCLASRNATIDLVEQINKIKPDIIHLHNLHGYYLNIEILFNYLARNFIPVVWTLHDCWSFTGHCVYFDYVGCERWKTGCFDCPQKKTYPSSYFYDRSKKNYSLKNKLFNSINRLTIVPVSDWLSKIISQSFLAEHLSNVIKNGIDIDVFSPTDCNEIKKKYNLDGKYILLGVAGIWSPRKGLSEFIKLSENLDSNYQIILVGLSSSQIKSLPKNIIGISKTESLKELAEYYSVADIYLNPTLEDNFPTTNLESLACGTPVITYNTGGSKESISADTGFVVEKGDIQGLINAIVTIQKKGKNYYSLACTEHARMFYNKNDRYMDYLKLYEKILTNI
jgi:putative colanic acid biosynthesis glycosyltransferase